MHRPRLELGGRRATGSQRRVDLQQLGVRDHGELRGACQPVGELRTPGGTRDVGLERQRLRGGSGVGAREDSLARGKERDSVEAEPGRCPHELGTARAERVIGDRIDVHGHTVG